jgi:hypothetical protein
MTAAGWRGLRLKDPQAMVSTHGNRATVEVTSRLVRALASIVEREGPGAMVVKTTVPPNVLWFYTRDLALGTRLDNTAAVLELLQSGLVRRFEVGPLVADLIMEAR